MKTWLQHPAMKGRHILAAVLAGLAVLEAVLWFFPLSDRYAGPSRIHQFLPVWNAWVTGELVPPYVKVFQTGPLIGVSTTMTRLNINKYGFLYDTDRAAQSEPGELRIAVVGGSTVECNALQAEKRWPELVEVFLAKSSNRKVKVFNMGISAQDTRSHLATVAQLAVKLNLDYIVFLAGANDLFRSRQELDPLLEKAFIFPQYRSAGPIDTLKWVISRSQIGRRLLHIKKDGRLFARTTPYFFETMEGVKTAPFLEEPSLDVQPDALVDYERNLISLAALAEAHGIKPIFATQPMLWKKDMSNAEVDVDWMGTIFRRGSFYRLRGEDSARLLGQLNQRLLDLCQSKNWRCVDLAKSVPRTLGYFYDSVHFNERGSQLVAEVVGREIEKDLAR